MEKIAAGFINTLAEGTFIDFLFYKLHQVLTVFD